MTEKDIRSEIEELKAKLESLSSPGGQGAGQSAAGAAADAADDIGASGWLRDIMKQAEELMGGLDLQLKDVPAKTALMIFALGVVMGRLLSKRD
jgi:ElaB/YqjD/DUF883 family membrane-anchored ribosome-binding protein